MDSILVVFCCTICIANAIRINTKLGEIEGITNDDGVHSFLNIPYAEPPVGELRWKPTKPLINPHFGDKCYDATKWGNAVCNNNNNNIIRFILFTSNLFYIKFQCAQPSMGIGMSNDTAPQFIEDCLYLNIFTPQNFDDKSQQKLRPVMFWYV